MTGLPCWGSGSSCRGTGTLVESQPSPGGDRPLFAAGGQVPAYSKGTAPYSEQGTGTSHWGQTPCRGTGTRRGQAPPAGDRHLLPGDRHPSRTGTLRRGQPPPTGDRPLPTAKQPSLRGAYAPKQSRRGMPLYWIASPCGLAMTGLPCWGQAPATGTGPSRWGQPPLAVGGQAPVCRGQAPPTGNRHRLSGDRPLPTAKQPSLRGAKRRSNPDETASVLDCFALRSRNDGSPLLGTVPSCRGQALTSPAPATGCWLTTGSETTQPPCSCGINSAKTQPRPNSEYFLHFSHKFSVFFRPD
jgi:hypothetical protein